MLRPRLSCPLLNRVKQKPLSVNASVCQTLASVDEFRVRQNRDPILGHQAIANLSVAAARESERLQASRSSHLRQRHCAEYQLDWPLLAKQIYATKVGASASKFAFKLRPRVLSLAGDSR